MPSRNLTPTPRTVYPNRYRQHPLANRIPAPYAALNRPACPLCITIPNGYNPGPYCLRHAPEQPDAEYHRELDRELDKAAREAAKARTRKAVKSS